MHATRVYACQRCYACALACTVLGSFSNFGPLAQTWRFAFGHSLVPAIAECGVKSDALGLQPLYELPQRAKPAPCTIIRFESRYACHTQPLRRSKTGTMWSSCVCPLTAGTQAPAGSLLLTQQVFQGALVYLQLDLSCLQWIRIAEQ